MARQASLLIRWRKVQKSWQSESFLIWTSHVPYKQIEKVLLLDPSLLNGSCKPGTVKSISASSCYSSKRLECRRSRVYWLCDLGISLMLWLNCIPPKFMVLLMVKNLPDNAEDVRDSVLIPGLGRFPWTLRAWQLTPVFMPGESHGQRSLVGYGPQGSQRFGQNWSNLSCMYGWTVFPKIHMLNP